jgi:hypothetical protein
MKFTKYFCILMLTVSAICKKGIVFWRLLEEDEEVAKIICQRYTNSDALVQYGAQHLCQGFITDAGVDEALAESCRTFKVKNGYIFEFYVLHLVENILTNLDLTQKKEYENIFKNEEDKEKLAHLFPHLDIDNSNPDIIEVGEAKKIKKSNKTSFSLFRGKKKKAEKEPKPKGKGIFKTIGDGFKNFKNPFSKKKDGEHNVKPKTDNIEILKTVEDSDVRHPSSDDEVEESRQLNMLKHLDLNKQIN